MKKPEKKVSGNHEDLAQYRNDSTGSKEQDDQKGEEVPAIVSELKRHIEI